MNFKEKTVFITGGSRGIGLEVVKKPVSYTHLRAHET